jgi:MinD superfamily P-loop ATPase
MLIASGFSAEINSDLCEGCGICQDFCQFSAIEIISDKAVVNLQDCFGCGVCVDKCQNKAAILREDPSKGIPLEIHKLMDGVRLVS